MIKSLEKEGIKVKLHIFDNTENSQRSQFETGSDIAFYETKTGHDGFSFFAPFFISSKFDTKLIETVIEDNSPLLFHGLETTSNLRKIDTHQRKVFIRILDHEIKSQSDRFNGKINKKNLKWYDIFSMSTSNYITKLSSQFSLLVENNDVLNISNPREYNNNTEIIPAFIGMPIYAGESGQGNFCLFQGNFNNPGTTKAALWLLNNIFNEIDIPLVVSGENPSKELEIAAHRQLNTCLVSNPLPNEKMELMKKSQLIILPGIHNEVNRYEIIQSMILGKHLISNEPIPVHAEKLMHTEIEKEKFKQLTKKLFETQFQEEEKYKREAFLQENWNDQKTVSKLIKLLY
jgi:hypothetical protein